MHSLHQAFEASNSSAEQFTSGRVVRCGQEMLIDVLPFLYPGVF